MVEEYQRRSRAGEDHAIGDLICNLMHACGLLPGAWAIRQAPGSGAASLPLRDGGGL